MRSSILVVLLALVLSALSVGCTGGGGGASGGSSLPNGLLVALAQFEVSDEGKVLPRPGPARLEMLVQRDGEWTVQAIEDTDSIVFHKAMVYDAGDGPGIVTFAGAPPGSPAQVKLWRHRDGSYVAETMWEKNFGGKFSRMRDGELVDLGDGKASLAVATHDQGVVSIVAPDGDGWSVREIDAEASTIVHEIEIGDLDGDGKPEVYATPSEPNKLDGTAQRGAVVAYDPTSGDRRVVADLGNRHAKEILVEDVDGDGRDELYVSVEAVEGGQLEIRRYDADTDPAAGKTIAVLSDRLCRFLTAGDVDGDGKKELVAAAHKSGVWLFRPGADGSWSKVSIDRDSSGFEHAAILVDLDEDGVDELYVASDDQGEIRRYVWKDGKFDREVIHAREVPGAVFTWNLTPVPADLVH